MSKIEVNTVEPQCGTTLTLGGSGDTVALGTGASQTGFGRTGTVDWETTPKTTTFTAANGSGYFANTTAGTFTMNMPAGSAGSIVSVADYAGTWQTYKLTVSPNGTDKMGGLNLDVELNTEGQSVTFVYVDAVQGWINTMDSTSNARGLNFMSASVSGACNTLATCGNYKIATFKGPGTFTVCSVSCTASNNIVDYVVVAGGGGGGSGCGSGAGGGAGGFRYYANTTNNPQGCASATPINNFPSGAAVTVSATPYPITVGGGGPGGSGTTAPTATSLGTKGNDSVFDTITSTGGGFGTSGRCGGPVDGGPGGSGGGSARGRGAGGTGNTPSVPVSQGNAGGQMATPSDTLSGAGGGGALAVGGDNVNVPTPSSGYGGTGGAGGGIKGFGTTGEPSGGHYYFSGGGGGGSFYAATDTNPGTPATNAQGGIGGGGPGAMAPDHPGTYSAPASPLNKQWGANGTDNTGGGGGGGGESPTAGIPTNDGSGGSGGSGIVIIRYRFQ